jgi:hypothetical protein
MWYLDILVGLAVKESPDGRKLFFPWGAFSRAYVVETKEHERVVWWIVGYQLVQLAIVFPALIYSGWYTLLIVPAVIFSGFLLIDRLIRGMLPADNPAAGNELGVRFRAYSPFTLWSVLLVTLFFAALGASEFLGGDDRLMGGLVTLVSICGAYSAIRALRFHAREKRSGDK